MKTQIRRILVPLDSSEYTDAATIRACEIAKAHDADLTGLSVLDSPQIRSSVAPADTFHWPVVQDTIHEAMENARQDIQANRDKFDNVCVAKGVRHSTPKLEGAPAQVIYDVSALYDLVVMGLRTFFHFDLHTDEGESLSRLLDQTVTPVLAVPKGEPTASFNEVLVLYDGSKAAAKTLRDFAAFAAPSDFQVTVLTATEDDRQAEMLLHEACACLTSHGIENVHTKRSNQKEVTSDTLSDFDLVVLGIHSKRLLRDRFVGSLAKRLIDDNDRALFLSH
ncbi:MAG: universal stress protein [Verrucomicrobiota bacterium]